VNELLQMSVAEPFVVTKRRGRTNRATTTFTTVTAADFSRLQR
jgi:hypothetical protein